MLAITLLIIIIYITNRCCNDTEFTYKAQSVLSFQKMLFASEISSRYQCFYFQISCNFFSVVCGPYFTSLELCYSAVSLLYGPHNLACSDITATIIICLMPLLMLTVLSCGIYQKALCYLFCMTFMQGHSYSCDVSSSSHEWY